MTFDPDEMTRKNMLWAMEQGEEGWDPNTERQSHDPERWPNGDYDEHWVDLKDDRDFWESLGVDTGRGAPGTLTP